MFNNVTVIGSGLMGSSIAAHLTNAGCKVNLLDVVSDKSENRNFLADEAVKKLINIKPSPITTKSNLKKITTGNIEDDLDIINSSEWIIEAVIENLPIKRELYKKIETIMKNNLIVSSNTSTIPLHKLTENMSDKFKNNFLITHFFNPPRYLKLLEIVTSNDTNENIKTKIINFCDINLGKSVIKTKDTPGFIGNRIGIFWIERASIEALNLELTVEEADIIIKNIFNVPKSGVFGLIDIVGLDLMPLVVDSLLQNIPKTDLYHSIHQKPELFDYMLENKMIGRKGKGGFYKLVKKNGKRIKYSLNLKTRKYYVSKKPQVDSLKIAKYDLIKFFDQKNKYSNYAWTVLSEVLLYVLTIANEISSNIHSIDAAMRDGFGWKQGPFEIIDKIGPTIFKSQLTNSKKNIPEILEAVGNDSFYKVEDNEIKFFDLKSKEYLIIERPTGVLLLSDIKKTKQPINKISNASLWDIGDGVTVFEIHSKGNSINMEVMEFLNQSIDLVTSSYKAMIIYNEGDYFSAGANLAEALFLSNIGLESELDKNILSKGQEVYTKLKYSNFPVVASPFNLTLGGGCEIILHSDFIQAHIESYIGLTEAALGILPAWGGCKEMLSRFVSNKDVPNGPMPAVLKTFELIGMAKVSTSAHEAKQLGYLQASDGITMNRNRLLYDAKKQALRLVKDYNPPKKTTYRLPGKTAAAAMNLAIENMISIGQISEHDQFVGKNISTVLSGGDTDITKEVNEEYILKLEKNAIYRLFKKNLTIERLEYVLETGKYLRN